MNKNLKVIHLSFGDKFGGGAARASWRIHESLLSIGVDSRMIVWKNSMNEDGMSDISSKKPKKYKLYRYRLVCFISEKITKLMKSNNSILHSINRFGVISAKKINKLDADIIHMHWIAFEFIKIEELKKIKKPIVFHLHDLWLILGSEHYPLDKNDQRYKFEYSKKSRHKDHKKIDIDRYTYLRKKKTFKNLKGNIIASTSWVKSYADNSALFNPINVNLIPIPIDLNIFRPLEKTIARKALNLPQESSIILFGAIGGAFDVRKGFHLLVESLKKIKSSSSNNIEIIVFGNEKPYNAPDFGFKTTYVRKISHESLLALYYAAADVFINPTLMEAFGQTTLEAISCGTPVVAYNYSGTTDIIEHKVNGYLATPFSSEDFASGIEYCLQEEFKEQLSENCIKKSKQFEKSKIANQLKAYYETLI